MKIWIGAAILGLVYGALSVGPASASGAGWRHGHHKHHGHHQTRRDHGYHRNGSESGVDGCRYLYRETLCDQDSGIDYRVTPQPGYRSHDGAYCREYQTMATIGGCTESAYGTACRQPDGSWRLVN